MEAAQRKVWSFHDDAIIARFIDFLAEHGKTIESDEADGLFDQFLAKQGDDSYAYWESHWDSPTNIGGDDASSAGVRK